VSPLQLIGRVSPVLGEGGKAHGTIVIRPAEQ